MSAPVEIPRALNAGTTLRAELSDPSHAAPDWTAVLVLTAATAVTTAGLADGTVIKFTVAAADTAAWAPGPWAWVVRATRASDGLVSDVADGLIQVRPDPTQTGARTQARLAELRTDLAAINATLSGSASSGIMSYAIGNRQASHYSMAELLKLKGHITSQIWKLKHPGQVIKGAVLPP